MSAESLRVAFGVSVLANGLAGGGVDGIGSVTRELMQRLHALSGLDLMPYVYADTPPYQFPDAMGVGTFQRQAMLSLLTGLSFPRMKQRLQGRVDLVHATDHMIPRLRGTPVLATLMDAIPLSHPDWITYRYKSIYNECWRRSAHWADHVVTISEFSRQQIVRWFGIPERRISVVPLGVDERWFAAAAENKKLCVRENYELPENFFLFIGTLQPRKNLALLIEAHGALPADVRHSFPLIVVGRNGWGCDALVARLRSAAVADVRWLEYVPQKDLPVLLGLARALVFPSLYEGFGLPVLEAFAAGVPVIAANATSIPEVAGDAAILADPLDAGAWREAMLRMVQEPDLAQLLQEKGRLRAKAFSWDKTAAATHALYKQLAG